MICRKKKPDVFDATTFDEFIAYGRDNGANIVNGMPWSFRFCGHPVSHETDDCYIITPKHQGTVIFRRGNVLVLANTNEITPYTAENFAAIFEPVPEP